MSEVDWGRYNLPAIWALISDVDVCDGADRVLAWDGLSSAVRDQHTRLLTAADNLAAVWPPGKNDSALEFQRQVKGLADSMQETVKKAEDTRAGLNGVVQAFSAAQSRVRELAAGREGVSDDWMPRFVDHAEDKYDEQAQAAMREAEAAISDHGTQIQSPKLYELRATKDDGRQLLPPDRPGGGGGDSPSGGTSRTPMLRATPVPVSDHPAAADPGNSGAVSGAVGAGARSLGSDSGLGVGTGSDASGPILSGIAPSQPPLIGVPGGQPAAPPALGGPLGNPVATPPGVGGLGVSVPGAFGVLPFGRGNGTDGVPSRAGPAGRRQAPARRAMPSGAVIGESVEPMGSRGAMGVAPVGAAPVGGAPGGSRSGRRGGGAGGAEGEADQRWETDEGVAPVICPDSTPIRHDPGPGVIGFDR